MTDDTPAQSVSQSAPHRYLVLDSWRGIAACFIALIHVQLGMNSHLREFQSFYNASLFVDFFFVLSGFVIFANYAQRLSEGFGFWRFMLLRFGRLWPLHVFVLGIYIGFELLQMAVPQLGSAATFEPFSQTGESPAYILSALLLVHAMGFFPDDIVSFSGASWSISTEFYAYALFALMILLLKKHIKIGLAVVFIASGWFLYSSGIHLLGTFFQFGFIRCIYSFSAGAMLWYVLKAYEGRIAAAIDRVKGWNVLEISMIAALAWFLKDLARTEFELLITLLFATMILVFSYERGFVSRLLKMRGFVLLGTLSYSIYLLHGFIAGKGPSVARFIAGNLSWDITETTEQGTQLLGANPWQGDLFTLGYMIVVIGCAFVTYTIVEKPSRLYFRKLAQNMKTKTWQKITA